MRKKNVINISLFLYMKPNKNTYELIKLIERITTKHDKCIYTNFQRLFQAATLF